MRRLLGKPGHRALSAMNAVDAMRSQHTCRIDLEHPVQRMNFGDLFAAMMIFEHRDGDRAIVERDHQSLPFDLGDPPSPDFVAEAHRYHFARRIGSDDRARSIGIDDDPE